MTLGSISQLPLAVIVSSTTTVPVRSEILRTREFSTSSPWHITEPTTTGGQFEELAGTAVHICDVASQEFLLREWYTIEFKDPYPESIDLWDSCTEMNAIVREKEHARLRSRCLHAGTFVSSGKYDLENPPSMPFKDRLSVRHKGCEWWKVINPKSDAAVIEYFRSLLPHS
jgi:hypothetical protein